MRIGACSLASLRNCPQRRPSGRLDILEQRYTITRKQQLSTQSPRQEAIGSGTRSSSTLFASAQPYKGSAMTKVHVSTVINAPIERVWRTVSDFNGLPAWMPGMKDSTIEDGKGATEIGAVRRLVNGRHERQTARAARGIVAAGSTASPIRCWKGPLPVKKIVTTMQSASDHRHVRHAG